MSRFLGSAAGPHPLEPRSHTLVPSNATANGPFNPHDGQFEFVIVCITLPNKVIIEGWMPANELAMAGACATASAPDVGFGPGPIDRC
jgi:hypothetical protein